PMDGCTFPIVIMDEAGQSSEQEAMIPLSRGCKMAILVGDPKQLPPFFPSLNLRGTGPKPGPEHRSLLDCLLDNKVAQ
ncbi:putative ATP-dependent helicase C29A10.10c, partial [Tetrabaena socialis]